MKRRRTDSPSDSGSTMHDVPIIEFILGKLGHGTQRDVSQVLEGCVPFQSARGISLVANSEMSTWTPLTVTAPGVIYRRG